MAEITITGWETRDVRFPTSLDKTGSDAMNAAGDYSAAYCILKTDSQFTGHGMVSFGPVLNDQKSVNNPHRHLPLDEEMTLSARQLRM
jgi:hypothetical protein